MVVRLFTMLPARDGWRLPKHWSHTGQRLIWRTRLVPSNNSTFYISVLVIFRNSANNKVWYPRMLSLSFFILTPNCTQVGCTPLHRAASTGKSELCELLIEEGADVDAVDKAGQTPLMNAVICENKEVAFVRVVRKISLPHRIYAWACGPRKRPSKRLIWLVHCNFLLLTMLMRYLWVVLASKWPNFFNTRISSASISFLRVITCVSICH